MRPATRPLAAGLLLVPLVLVAGCTPGATHRAAPATPPPTTATTVPATQPQASWNRPGDEWGTGFVFPEAGCWDLRLVRTSGSGDVWLVAR
jgi:hypothetical protein